MSRKFVVGVMGPGKADEIDMQLAWDLGKLIAENNWIALTGARPVGIMDEVLRAAKEFGGQTLGIIPSGQKSEASPYADIVIPTNMGDARNALNVLASDAVIAIKCQSAGTVSEAALAIKGKRPLVLLKANDTAVTFLQGEVGRELVSVAQTPEEAIRIVRLYATPVSRLG